MIIFQINFDEINTTVIVNKNTKEDSNTYK